MSTSPSARDSALSYISNSRFHRRFTLPATTDHGPLTISYADLGADPDLNPPTILFMPGMFASRYLGAFFHTIAKNYGVRVLVVDRFGMGSTTDVPLQQRVPIWVELVPRLLAHLHVAHVALMSHCAGTVYLLNTLIQCREILDPQKPFVALLAPWVDPSHSHITSMQLAQYIPSKAFSVWHLIPKFLILKAGPVFASSGVAMNKASNTVASSVSIDGGSSSELESNRRRIEERHGLSRDVQAELETLVMNFMFEENTVGANSEALQCLRKGPAGIELWGKCADYQDYVRELVGLERRQCANTAGRDKLKIRTFFAESDAMIGKAGQKYVENCWHGREGEFDNVLDFETKTVAGTDHDQLVLSLGVLESAFSDAGGNFM
ncbi:hypothetical protein BDV25DRAFT_159840 [Aspergillus avenaceus]|uniref:AB hydrolase-1 domain-containing protein n=1 Tax=Aspergillus avenaceus TaxID=36643 RepID=A0A5N6TMR9_ASPAV|nr:hypothetical protein BDV25DRAFT_159840 [Aspergillus avenaceus]